MRDAGDAAGHTGVPFRVRLRTLLVNRHPWMVTARRRGLAGPILIGSQVALAALLVASVGYILIDIATNVLLGCLPGDSQSSEGPAPDISFFPPGVNCTYRLSADDGLLTVGPSPFPTLLALTCVAGLVALSKVKKLSNPWTHPAENAPAQG